MILRRLRRSYALSPLCPLRSNTVNSQKLEIGPEVRQALDAQRTKLAGVEIPANVEPGLRQSLKEAVDESFVAGYRRVMVVSMLLALLSALSAWLLIAAKTKSEGKS